MSDIIDMMDSLLASSKNLYKSKKTIKKPQNWLECINLHIEGWANEKCEDIENSESILLTWKKDQISKGIKLTLREQLLWLEYLEHESKKEKK